MVSTAAQPRPLRADAARNRARIIAAAAEVFAERGLDVTLDDIAAHAGLGVGTVYRRFADREELVEALFDERMQKTSERMQAALQVPAEQAGAALITVIRDSCEEVARDRGLRQVMLSSAYGQNRIARCRDEMRVIVEELVVRAKATGELRPDFEATDVAMLFLMVGAIVDFAGPVAPDLWRRYFEMLMDGLRAGPENARLVDAPHCPHALEQTELLSAMQGWSPGPLR
jgi:AcrR family transcriptional regulator